MQKKKKKYAYSGIRNVKEASKRPGTKLDEDHQLSMNVQHGYRNRYKTKKRKKWKDTCLR